MGTVLLVDDDPGVLAALSDVIAARGHRYVAASSAAETLARAGDVDVVVADFSMPTTGGVELLRDLYEREPALPVILLTAQGAERLAVRAMKDGAYGYLSRPFDDEEMLLTVERAMETRRLRAQTRPRAAEESSGARIADARCAALPKGPIMGARTLATEDGSASDSPASKRPRTLKEQVEAFERSILTSALAATGGNQSEVSRRLGVTRASLYDRMKKYGLSSARRN